MAKEDLTKKIQTLEQEIEAMKTDVGTKQKELSTKTKIVQSLKQKMATVNAGKPIITDHAVVRYLERVKGMNIAEVEKEILSEATIELVKKFEGVGTFPCDGFRIVVKNNVVVTIKI